MTDSIYCFFYTFLCRVLKDGTVRTIHLFGKGLLCYIDSLFFYLPLASPKQATATRKRFHVPDEEWENHSKGIEDEYDAPGARDQLRTSWKTWLQGGSAKPGAGPKIVLPASTKPPVCNDDD